MKIICLNEIRIGIFPWMDCYRTIAQLQRMGIILKFPLYVLGTWPFRACEIRPSCLFILLFSFICNASSLVVNRYLRILHHFKTIQLQGQQRKPRTFSHILQIKPHIQLVNVGSNVGSNDSRNSLPPLAPRTQNKCCNDFAYTCP